MTTLTQIYAGGMIFILPIADIVEKRRLVSIMLLCATGSLILMVVSNIYILSLIACFLIGLISVTPQLLLPIAASMAQPEEREKVVGTILSGLLIGILLSRVLSGIVGEYLGWKSIFGFAAAFAFILCGFLFKIFT
jgi:predicted MFS family arabinose efflux permease